MRSLVDPHRARPHRLLRLMFLLLATAATGVPAAADDQAPEPTAVELRYELPRDAQVSIVITNPQGQVVRELLHAAPRDAGENVELWDGLNFRGEPVPAGDYAWKLLATQGLGAEYLLTLGTNANPRWASWPGNLFGAVSVATDAQGRMYVGAGKGEGTALLVAQTIDGEERLWDIPRWLDAWQGAKQLARAGDNLYILQSNAKVYVYDAATGKRKTTWSVGNGYVGYYQAWVDGEQNVVNLAGDREQLLASYLREDAVHWLDLETGQSLDQAAIEDPWDVDTTPGGRIIAISGNRIVAFTREDKTPTVLVEDLTEPHELAVDRETGQILVWCHGNQKQVLRYSPEGELLNTYGKPGGRSMSGAYEPTSFHHVTDLAAVSGGRFMIVESFVAPRRVSLFDREGNVLREWYGGQQYSNHAAADPDDPTLVWMDSEWGDLIRARVDYENKTWKVLGTYRFKGMADGLIKSTRHGHGRWRPIKRNGQTYLLRDTGQLQLMRYNEAEDRLEPLAAGWMKIRHYWDNQPQRIKDLASGDSARDAFVWSDLDGDRQVDDQEIRFPEWSKWGPGGWNMGPDFNLYFSDDGGSREPTIGVLPVVRWTEQGVPVYADWGEHKTFGKLPDAVPGGGRGKFLYPAEDGSVYGVYNFKDAPAFGSGHFGGKVSNNRLVKWNPDGSVAWFVGRHASSSNPEPGAMHFFWRIYGTVKNAVAAGDAHRATGVWTDDGLWIGRLLENPVETEENIPRSVYNSLMWENFHGSIYERPDTGEVLYFAAVINQTHVFRITGWDQFHRQQRSFTLSPEQAARIVKRVQTQRSRKDLLRLKPFSGPVDTKIEKWKKAGIEPLQIKDGDRVVAEVYAGWNGRGVQALFDVKTERPWATATTPQLAFQNGAGVDIKIALPEGETTERPFGGYRVVAIPEENEPAGVVDLVDQLDEQPPGLASVDQPEPSRLLETQTVEFYPTVPVENDLRHPRPATYETAQGKITFERVVRSDRNQSAARLHADDSGYIVELRAHFHDVVNPRPGRRLRIDFSVFLANSDGNATDLRLPYFSDDPDDTMTADVYYESLLRPKNWVETVLIK